MIRSLKKVLAVVISVVMVFGIGGFKIASADEVSDAGLINFDILKDENGEWIDYEDLATSEQIDAYNKLYNIQEDNDIFMRTQGGGGKDGTVKAKLKYTISGLKDKVIQSFFVCGNIIYVTQATDTGTVYIYKCNIDGDKAVASEQQMMTIYNAGHGTTLAAYNYKGKEYLLVCAKAKEIEKNVNGEIKSQCYTIQVGRTEFQAGKKIEAKEIKRFCNFDYANNRNSSSGELKQVIANISTDNQMIYFRVEGINGYLEHTAYSFSVFNEQLDNANENLVSFKDNDMMKKAIKFSFKQNQTTALSPNGLCQGTDITNKKDIYVVSGNDIIDKQGNWDSSKSKPHILAKMNSNGDYVKSYIIKIPAINSNPMQLWEAEGIQIINSNFLYVGMSPKKTENVDVTRKCAYIFSIDYSSI